MNIDKEFVPYQESLELKELGFDEPCFGWFTFGYLRIGAIVENKHVQGDGELLAPTFSQAFKFFREKYDLQCWSEPTGSDRYSCRYDGNDETGRRWVGYLRNNNKEILFHPTYEEAELACLRKLIQIVKEKTRISTN